MELVVDANVVFSALIKDSHTRHMLLFSGWTFYAPEFLLEEIRNHISELENKTKLNRNELDEIIRTIFRLSNIQSIPFSEFMEYLEDAEKISPDPDDALYFALALKFGCAIWSNDKRLKSQKKIRVYTTDELSRMR